LITNGGPHPADKWASVTAGQIASLVQIDEDSSSKEAVAARQAKAMFETELAIALTDHHEAVQARVRAKAADHPTAARADDVDAALGVVDTAAAKTPFATWYSLDHVRAVVRATLCDHFAGSIADVRHYALKGN
jgi:hypothetical protein